MNQNCFILTDNNESVIIDPGQENKVLLDRIKELNVKYILLTHGHYDHIGALAAAKKLSGAKVCVHALDADKLSDVSKCMADAFGINKIEKIEPDIILNDNDELTFGSKTIKILHTPGHSAGSVSYVIDNHIFTGDTLFCLTYGRYDFFDGDVRALVASIDRLMEYPDEYVVHPGHNIDTTIGAERSRNRYTRLKRII